MHKLMSLLLCGLLLAFFAGCKKENAGSAPVSQSGGAPAARPAAAKITIGVTLLTRVHPFYQELEKALKDEAAKNGYEILVTTSELDVARQKDQISDFITKKVNAIIVCPADSKSIGTSIQEANQADIPVFTADISCLAEGAKVVSHIASDNLEGGRLAARALAQAIGGAGNVAIIEHPEVESCIQRVKGFRAEMANHPEIKIVTQLAGGAVKDKAFKVTEDVLQAHPNLNGIFAINDDTALGALAAVEKAGKQGQVKIVGFDAVPEARKAISEGKIFADVIQRPDEIGRQTIQAIGKYLAGDTVEPRLLIPCQLYMQSGPAAGI